MTAAHRAFALFLFAFAALTVSGCAATSDVITHLRDLRDCQPTQPPPELFTDSGGWDNRNIDNVRCSNEKLQAVKGKDFS